MNSFLGDFTDFNGRTDPGNDVSIEGNDTGANDDVRHAGSWQWRPHGRTNEIPLRLVGFDERSTNHGNRPHTTEPR